MKNNTTKKMTPLEFFNFVRKEGWVDDYTWYEEYKQIWKPEGCGWSSSWDKKSFLKEHKDIVFIIERSLDQYWVSDHKIGEFIKRNEIEFSYVWNGGDCIGHPEVVCDCGETVTTDVYDLESWAAEDELLKCKCGKVYGIESKMYVVERV
jgi:hypothetical protein